MKKKLTKSKMGGGSVSNNKVTPTKNKTLAIVFGIFALVIVTTGASFAFFQYSRTGNTKVNVTSGDIQFSYMEDNQDASLTNAFPVADSVGAVDIAGEYEFTVSMTSSSSTTVTKYNVILLDNNKGTSNYFSNDQIKFALVKNNVYVAGTSTEHGLKLSEVDGFTTGLTTGEGAVLSDQEITSGTTDTYKLRIWISDDVSYNNTITSGEETGKYNGYTYSLKVKITAGTVNNSTAIEDVSVTDDGVITAEISDPKGLKAYAVTNSSTAPASNSDEWIAVTDTTAMNESNIQRMSNSLITSKMISFTATEKGTYYIHVKNSSDEISKKQVKIEHVKVIKLAADYIKDLAQTNVNELRIDEHDTTGQQNFATTEYRYFGATPNNYVTFNNELWRIIGVFDVDNGANKIEKRVKIVRNESIGVRKWNETQYNEWTTSTLNTYLNGEYFTNLSNTAKSMIENSVYYLGGAEYGWTKEQVYYNERGTRVVTGNSTKTTSTIALMYLSDYLYAAPSTCNSLLNEYGTVGCYDNDYLFKNDFQWTLTPHALYSMRSFFVRDSGGTIDAEVDNTLYSNNVVVRPVAYLSSNIVISSGIGTMSDPFQLSLS